MLRKAAAIGLSGLVVGVAPTKAASIGDGTTVALTMVGGGAVLSVGCLALSFLVDDEEEDEDGYDRRGFYAGLSGSYARETFSDSSIVNLVDGELQQNLRNLRGTPNLVTMDPGVYTFSLAGIDDDTFGFAGRGGYRCHPHISTEIQFEWLDDYEGTVAENGIPMNDSPRQFDLELESLVFTTNVKGHLLTGRTQPFVLLGVGFMRMESKARDSTAGPTIIAGRAAQASDREVNVAFRFGAGVDYYITKNIAATAEGSYLLPTGKLDGLGYYMFGIGLQYRF